jgi:hypothetical protein
MGKRRLSLWIELLRTTPERSSVFSVAQQTIIPELLALNTVTAFNDIQLLDRTGLVGPCICTGTTLSWPATVVRAPLECSSHKAYTTAKVYVYWNIHISACSA